MIACFRIGEARLYPKIEFKKRHEFYSFSLIISFLKKYFVYTCKNNLITRMFVNIKKLVFARKIMDKEGSKMYL